MLDFFPGIRRTMPNKDGSFNIKIVVQTDQGRTFMSTPYNIDSISEWSDGRVVRRPDADFINTYLTTLTTRLRNIRDSKRVPSGTAPQVKKWFEVQLNNGGDGLFEFMDTYIRQLNENGQKSYANNMGYTKKALIECFGETFDFGDITLRTIEKWESWLFKKGYADTTVNIRMTHLKAIVNAAIDDEVAEYKVNPFRKYRMPSKTVRDICISREELIALRDFSPESIPQPQYGPRITARRYEVARDLFMLSFYMGGINLTDIFEANVKNDIFTFVRKKTAGKKAGEKRVSLTIQPEAREIIGKYIQPDGTMDFGYGFSEYVQFRSYITKTLNLMGEYLGFENKLMFYSARKTFCQFGFELGIPLYILEYAIGQTIKDANNRPIFNYIKIMRTQADAAIRTIIDYVLGEPT